MTATDLAVSSPSGVMVLVAEGDADDSAALTTLLRLCGLNAHDVRTPAGVLEAIARTHPAVLILDLDMSGGELIGQVHALSDPPAVVVITAYTSERIRRTSIQAGAAVFLLKPAEPTEVVRVIRQLCTGRVDE